MPRIEGAPVTIIRPVRTKPEIAAQWIARIGASFAYSALLMLMVGVAHSIIDRRIPAFGYWQVYVGRLVLSMLGYAWSIEEYEFFTRLARKSR